jgi:hypothetical protein
MLISLSELRSLIEESLKPKRFYHGSSVELKVNQVLKGGRFKSPFGSQLEAYFEARRPKSIPGRLTGIFVVTSPRDIRDAGGQDDFVYEVEPLGVCKQHHQEWFAKAYNLVARNATQVSPLKIKKSNLRKIESELNSYVDSYWSGEKADNSINDDVWEWLTPAIKVIRQVKRR